MDDAKAWLSLLLAPDLGLKTCHRLLLQYKNAGHILAQSKSELQHAGLKPHSIAALFNPDEERLHACLSWLEGKNHHLITFHDPRYPELLKSITDPPTLLFVRGDPDFLNQPQLAMVGSRTPTASGHRTAHDFAQHLSQAGITITSGLARGIDGASHQGALKGLAGTVALVAHGLDLVYPASHRTLADAIEQNGAIVSEMPIGHTPSKGLFPRRNRIISGMAMGTLVVEAAKQSGSLITARYALEQGREVFAIPGSIHNPLSRGCHQLIREGAKLVETAEDILEELAGRGLSASSKAPNSLQDANNNEKTLDPDHQKLLKCLAYEPQAIDELVESSGFSAAEVASMLLILELNGAVLCENGRYLKC